MTKRDRTAEEGSWEPPEATENGREALLARIAWFYHVEGLTQQEIARKLGMHRLKVNRLLARCRQDGIVQISIRSPYVGCFELERLLVERFGLREALVVPEPTQSSITPEMIGAGLGHYLNRRLRPEMSLGIVSGRTFYGALPTLEPRHLPGFSVVSMLGGLTVRAALRPYEVAHRLAQIYEATCYYVPAPSYAESRRARDELLGQSLIQEVMRRAAAVDLAVHGAGRLSPAGVIRTHDLLDAAEVASLLAAGAVGTLLGWFIAESGELVDHPLNERVIALPLDRLKQIPEVVLCGGGKEKIVLLNAALRGGYAHVLITDEVAARGLMDRKFAPFG
jgi:DNA-binding transcriptional regulator LsrR (DeoR family)